MYGYNLHSYRLNVNAKMLNVKTIIIVSKMMSLYRHCTNERRVRKQAKKVRRDDDDDDERIYFNAA